MVKVNQLTDNKGKKLLLKICAVLVIATACTMLLSIPRKTSLTNKAIPTVNLPIIYEYAPIKITTADNKKIWLELYVEPYASTDLTKLSKNEQKIRRNIKQKLSAFTLSVLMFPENRRQITTILKKQIDLTLYPTTVKNIRFNLIQP